MGTPYGPSLTASELDQIEHDAKVYTDDNRAYHGPRITGSSSIRLAVTWTE